MATISKLKLSIEKGRSKSTVTISYDICFSKYEVMDKSTFIERISLKGDDASPNPDDHLLTIHSNCMQASKKCLPRKIVKKVSNKVLNEDDTFLNRTDEVYARVSLTPFKPKSTSANSNIEYDRF